MGRGVAVFVGAQILLGAGLGAFYAAIDGNARNGLFPLGDGQVAALVTAGYAHRERDAEDARVSLLTTTEAGRKVLTESHARMVAAVDAALAGWESDDVAALAERLDLLRGDFAAAAETTEENR